MLCLGKCKALRVSLLPRRARDRTAPVTCAPTRAVPNLESQELHSCLLDEERACHARD